MNHTVDKRGDAIDQRKLGTLFQVATPVVRYMKLDHILGFFQFFMLF